MQKLTFSFFWQVTLGNRRGLSKIDILQMKLLYKCSGGGGGPNPPPPTNKPPGLCICAAQRRKICLHYFFKFTIYLSIALTFHGTFQQEPQFPVVCLCMTHSWQRNHLEFFFFFNFRRMSRHWKVLQLPRSSWRLRKDGYR